MTRARHVPLDVAQDKILETARRLDEKDRLGGLVDLPRLRAALPFKDRALVDRALTGLHRQGDRASLSLANNPVGLPDGGEGGIWLPRGSDPTDRSCFYWLALPARGA